MEFGWYHEFHRQVERQSDADAFAQALDQVADAERWGLDAIWLAEIHQQAARSVLTRAADRRRRHRHAHQPDQDRHRGAGAAAVPSAAPRRGNRDHRPDQPRAAAAGRRTQRQSARLCGVQRALCGEPRAILRDAGNPQDWPGRSRAFPMRASTGTFNEARAVPRPYQQPHPPIRIAGASEDTFPVLGELGYPLFVAVRSGSLSGLAPDLQAYRAAYAAAGHPGKGEVYLRLSLHLAETDAQALEEAEPSIMEGYKALTTRLEGSPNARRRAELETVRTITYEQVLRDKVVVGSAETGDGSAAAAARGAGDRRHPRRAEFRQRYPARADDAVATAAVREGASALRLTAGWAVSVRAEAHFIGTSL